MKHWYLIALAAIAAPVSAQIVFEDSPKIGKNGDPALDKMVCKYEETVGSRVKGHKVCATLREWQEQEEANKDATRDLQQKGQANPKGT